ncbi:hypothetical protein C0995_002331, partial [Termitomyces sp. Mi166
MCPDHQYDENDVPTSPVGSHDDDRDQHNEARLRTDELLHTPDTISLDDQIGHDEVSIGP